MHNVGAQRKLKYTVIVMEYTLKININIEIEEMMKDYSLRIVVKDKYRRIFTRYKDSLDKPFLSFLCVKLLKKIAFYIF